MSKPLASDMPEHSKPAQPELSRAEQPVSPAPVSPHPVAQPVKLDNVKETTPRVKTAETSGSSESSSDSEAGEEEQLSIPACWRYPYFETSASFRQLDFVGGWHQYTLTGDFFRVGGQLFRLEVYPAGFTTDVRKHLSVFLTTPGSVLANQVFHEISILDQSGKAKHITVKRDKKQGPCICMYRGVLAAHPKLVKLKDLTDKPQRYLRNDTLVIRATVEVVRSWSSRPAAETSGQPALPSPHGLGAALPPHGVHDPFRAQHQPQAQQFVPPSHGLDHGRQQHVPHEHISSTFPGSCRAQQQRAFAKNSAREGFAPLYQAPQPVCQSTVYQGYPSYAQDTVPLTGLRPFCAADGCAPPSWMPPMPF